MSRRARAEPSLAAQVLGWQVVLVVLLVLAGGAASTWLAQVDARTAARQEVVGVSESLARSPQVLRAALTASPSDPTAPSAQLQPYAEAVRRASGTDFVVVMATDRTRWTHPNPSLIGRPFIGDIAPALAGHTFTQTYRGTLGPSVRAVAPVRADVDGDGVPDPGGRVLALVSVGITTQAITASLLDRLPLLAGTTVLALALAALGAAWIGRRLRRQTLGLGPAQITRMFQAHDAVLHSVREGLLVVQGTDVVLANDEAGRLLGLPSAGPGGDRSPVAHADQLGPALAAVLTGPPQVTDAIVLSGERVLVVNKRPVALSADEDAHGAVVTLRDHTELEALSGELDAVRGFAESLRAQAHESANRLHTVVSLVELGRTEEAVAFATAELELAQSMTDELVAGVQDPALAAVLLGKAAQAGERGIALRLADGVVPAVTGLPARDLVTVLGNLVDNAMDAAAAGEPPRWVQVGLTVSDDRLTITVADSGRGLADQDVPAAFVRGYSTKAGTNGRRGLGLPLVEQVAHRHGGRVQVDSGRRAPGQEPPGAGTVFTVVLPLPAPVPR